MNRRSWLGAGASLLVASQARAEAWPARPVSVLVGFGAGGVLDVLVRIVAEELRADTGQPFVVENRAGASGMIAASAVARAAPDGTTLLAMSGTITIAPALMKSLAVDVVRDLAPITLFASSPNVLVVRPDFPARTVAEFLAFVRGKPPGEFAYATSGRGTTVHFMAGMLEQATGLSLRHVPYRSSADSIRAVVAGDVPMAFSSANSVLPFVGDAQVRVLGVATQARSPLLPDAETFREAGLRDVVSDTWFGLAASSRVSGPILAQIYARCAAVVTRPAMRDRLAGLGTIPLNLDPPATKALFDREVSDFAALAGRMGLGAE